MRLRPSAYALVWAASVGLVVAAWAGIVASGELLNTVDGSAVFVTMMVLGAPALAHAMRRRQPDEWTGVLWGVAVLVAMLSAARGAPLGAVGPVAVVTAMVTTLLPALLVVRHPALDIAAGKARGVTALWWLSVVIGVALIVVGAAGSVPSSWWVTDAPGPTNGVGTSLILVQTAVISAGALWCALVVLGRYRSMPRGARAALRPVVVPVVLWSVDAVISASWTASYGLLHPTEEVPAQAATVFVILPALLVAVLAGGIGWIDLVIRRPAPGARRVTEFESGDDRAERHLSRALADHTVRVLYATSANGVDGPPSWVDSHGRPVPEVVTGVERSVTLISRGETLIGMIEQDAANTSRPDAVELVATGAGLLMETERLTAAARRDLEHGRLLAVRLLSASDEPRAALREQLVAGPLAALTDVEQELAQGGALAAATSRLSAIAADVRRISHGVFPTSLTEGGVAAALPAATVPDRRYPPVIEMTAYLAAGSDHHARIEEASVAGGRALLISTATSPTVAVLDRVTALGGSVVRDGERWELRVPVGGTDAPSGSAPTSERTD